MNEAPTKEEMSREEATRIIREAAELGNVEYQCCFCHEAIEGRVHALGIVTDWNGPDDKQHYQQWFCHLECFSSCSGEPVEVA